eukprot:COSAG01_NODE_292_length_19376_cov_61.487239_10_plen_141_part_00
MGVSRQEKGRCWLVQVAHPSYNKGKRKTVARVKDTDHPGGKDEARAYAKLLFDQFKGFVATLPTDESLQAKLVETEIENIRARLKARRPAPKRPRPKQELRSAEEVQHVLDEYEADLRVATFEFFFCTGDCDGFSHDCVY